MDLKVLQKDKTVLKLEVQGEDHTFMNILRQELWQDKDLQSAGYTLQHALTTSPILLVQTAKKDPFKALDDAAKRLEEEAQDLKAKFKKAL